MRAEHRVSESKENLRVPIYHILSQSTRFEKTWIP